MTSTIVHESPHMLEKKQITPQRKHKGEIMAKECAQWMNTNKDMFFFMLNYVLQLRDHNIQGRLRDRVIMHCLEMRKHKKDETFKLTHGTFAGITRYMVLYEPRLDPDIYLDSPIRFADSDIDAFGLYDVGYLHLTDITIDEQVNPESASSIDVDSVIDAINGDVAKAARNLLFEAMLESEKSR